MHHIVIFDEVIAGRANGELFVVEQWGKLMPLFELIEFYQFPLRQGKHDFKLLWLLKGGHPALYDKVEFYEDESIEF